MIAAAVGLRTALIALAAFALPPFATVLTAAVAEFAMIAFIMRRIRP